MSSESITSLFIRSKFFCRYLYILPLRNVFGFVNSRCRVVIACRVPDPSYKPLALTFGGLTNHRILCKIIFSMHFPITECRDISMYALFF